MYHKHVSQQPIWTVTNPALNKTLLWCSELTSQKPLVSNITTRRPCFVHICCVLFFLFTRQITLGELNDVHQATTPQILCANNNHHNDPPPPKWSKTKGAVTTSSELRSRGGKHNGRPCIVWICSPGEDISLVRSCLHWDVRVIHYPLLASRARHPSPPPHRPLWRVLAEGRGGLNRIKYCNIKCSGITS